MERNHIDKIHALSSSVIGFEFEFYTNMLKGEASESIGKEIKKKIQVSEKYHSDIKVTSDVFKLEPDYSGGNKMVELITGPMEYSEAIPVMIKILNWIEKNGWTDDKCAFQFSVSFDRFRKDVKDRIENLDKLKFILGLDENFIYSKFGNRSNNVYANTVKRVVPVNRFSILENITSIDPKMFKVPDEKYYGVNFTKLKDGYLEFRYLGNRDYQKKVKEIREVVDYVILYLYDILSHRTLGYSKEDLSKLREMMKDYSKVVRSYSNPELFFLNFPDFHVFVDLKGMDENIKTYFPMIREKIFDLIIDGNVRSCYFNYDTTNGRFQVKDARIRDFMKIKDLDLISCDIKGGAIENCNLYTCDIKKVRIENCNIANGCKIKSSKVNDSVIEFSNDLTGCFVDCKDKNVNCKMEGGVLRSGNIGDYAQISKETVKVKGFNDIRNERFITDSRLKNLNPEIKRSKFGNLNY
jgi:hypothetical protein